MTHPHLKVCQRLAKEQAEKVPFNALASTPLELLNSIKWPDVKDARDLTQSTYIKWNLELDPRGCLGRVAVAGCIVQEHFPQTTIRFVEIYEDYFRNMLLLDLPQNDTDPTFIGELLMYEEPHYALLINGEQYEPLSSTLELNIVHPKIGDGHSFWEAVVAGYLVSLANNPDNGEFRDTILQDAENVCSGLLVVKENEIRTHLLHNDIKSAIRVQNEAVSFRKSARALLQLFTLTGESKYRDQIISEYSQNTFSYLVKRMLGEAIL